MFLAQRFMILLNKNQVNKTDGVHDSITSDIIFFMQIIFFNFIRLEYILLFPKCFDKFQCLLHNTRNFLFLK